MVRAAVAWSSATWNTPPSCAPAAFSMTAWKQPRLVSPAPSAKDTLRVVVPSGYAFAPAEATPPQGGFAFRLSLAERDGGSVTRTFASAAPGSEANEARTTAARTIMARVRMRRQLSTARPANRPARGCPVVV